MNIILADTHGPILGKAQATPNLSLLYLATYAKSFRPDLQFHYIPQKRQWSHHLEMVERLKPEIYAISFTSYGAPIAFKMMREIKAALSGGQDHRGRTARHPVSARSSGKRRLRCLRHRRRRSDVP